MRKTVRKTTTLPQTQRACTPRLAGAALGWRERLWRAHVAVNRGAGAFGGWLPCTDYWDKVEQGVVTVLGRYNGIDEDKVKWEDSQWPIADGR